MTMEALGKRSFRGEGCEELKKLSGCLAASREAARVGERHTEVFVRIDRSVVDPNFVVKVRTRGASAFAYVPNQITTLYSLPRGNRKSRKVTVAGADAVAMVDHDRLAIPAHSIGERHHTVSRGDDRVSIAAADIDAAVEGTFTVERIDAFSKAARYLAFHRPQIGGGVRFDPIRSSGVPGQPHRQANHRCARKGRSAQGMKLIERRAYFRVLNLLRTGCYQCRLSLKSVERGNFAGNRTQGCDL